MLLLMVMFIGIAVNNENMFFGKAPKANSTVTHTTADCTCIMHLLMFFLLLLIRQ